MKKDRLIAFTDAVLAIIMTILVLALEKPEEMTLEGFLALKGSYFAYALSFFWLGSVWIAFNSIWERVERVSRAVVWWNLIFLFFSSFMPYATGLVSAHFQNRLTQGFYGAIVIATTACNWILHKVIDAPNADQPALLEITRAYRRLLVPDLIIKGIALILTLTVDPECMLYGVLCAAAYMQLSKIVIFRIRGRKARDGGGGQSPV